MPSSSTPLVSLVDLKSWKLLLQIHSRIGLIILFLSHGVYEFKSRVLDAINTIFLHKGVFSPAGRYCPLMVVNAHSGTFTHTGLRKWKAIFVAPGDE